MQNQTPYRRPPPRSMRRRGDLRKAWRKQPVIESLIQMLCPHGSELELGLIYGFHVFCYSVIEQSEVVYGRAAAEAVAGGAAAMGCRKGLGARCGEGVLLSEAGAARAADTAG
jgi:hypothetical protein